MAATYWDSWPLFSGKYTPWAVCEKFLAETANRGISWSDERSAGDAGRGVWKGELSVEGLSREELGQRKANCWWWVGRWGESELRG